MKTITIKQPWAKLIVDGVKNIENRTWKTKFRGRVLIHAGKAKYENPFDLLSEAQFNSLSRDQYLEAYNGLEYSSIIGSVEIVDCVVNHKSIWAEKTQIPYLADVLEDIKHIGKPIKPKIVYNWVLENPILFPEPIPAKGKLLFWDYPNILAEPEENNGELFCHCQIPIDEKIQVMAFYGDCTCRYCGGRWYK